MTSKKNKTVNLISGSILFAASTIISISLFLGIIDFGTTSGALYRFGTMLYNVYGFSSLLIPVVLFIYGGAIIFGVKNSRQYACMIISILPFFTVAFAEHTIRSIAQNDSSPVAYVKISILALIAILVVACEYLLTLVIAGYIQNRKNGITPSQFESDTIEYEEEPEDSTENDDFTEEISPKKEKKSFKHLFAKKQKDSKTMEESYGETQVEPDEAFASLEINALPDDNWSLADILKKNRQSIESIINSDEDESENSEDNLSFDATENNQVKESPAEKKVAEDTATIIAKMADEFPVPQDYAEEDEDDIIAAFEQENAAADIDDTFFTPQEEPEEEKLEELPADESQDEINFALEEDQEFNPVEESSYESFDEEPEEEISEEDYESPQTAQLDKEMFGDDEDPFEMSEVYEDYTDDIEEEQEDYPEEDFSQTDKADQEEFSNASKTIDLPSTGHAMLSSLDRIFNKMDQDAANSTRTFSDELPVETSDENSAEQIKEDAAKSTDNRSNEQIAQDAYKNGPHAVITDKNGNTKPVPLKVQKKHGPYKVPTDLLTAYDENPYWIIDEETKAAAEDLRLTLQEFNIQAEVTGIKKGPVVTMFEILPAPGVKLSKIVSLGDNIALRLAASSVRIVAPIPGKRAVGIEIPNKDRAIVSFRELIEPQRPEWKKMAVPVVLGKDIQGDTQIMDLVKTPHLLIAGSTGAGKSVCVNSMILSILYKRSPDEVKLILIDPKVVELKLYNGIGHLLTPVITEPKKAMQALQYALCEMERRYAVLDGLGCRDIASYNKKIVEKHIATEKLPYIIIIVDEFADLMATTGKQLEGVLARLAAMSRAVGIHLVLATQRPSIDVITGLIKANIPSRIAFMVASKMDSRIIIDQVGAEKLLGKGDMLYASATDPFPVRIQGTFVSDGEVEAVVEKVKEWGEPEYIDDEIFVEDEEDDPDGQMSLFSESGDDPLFEKALEIVVQAGKASASYIQRRLKIGYNRAARLVEEMEERGIVGPANGSKPREIIHLP